MSFEKNEPGFLDDSKQREMRGSAELMEEIIEANPNVYLRPEQVACLDAIEACRDSGQEKALVQMATGLGKTLVMAADTKRFLAKNKDARILFLCHQNDILEQAKEQFEQIVGPEHSYGIFTGEGKDYHSVECLFASFQAMREWRVAFHRDEFDYLLVDEGHHSKAETYEATIEYFQPQFSLAMTATPDRLDGKDIRDIFDNEIFRYPLEQALADELLTPVEYTVLTDDIVETGKIKDLQGRIFSRKQLDNYIFVPKRDEEIVRAIEEKSDESTRRIVFCKNVEHAQRMASLITGGVPLHSRIPKNEQNQIITMFRRGAINTLLTVDMFNEGIDVPDANQIIFLRSTDSKTIFMQQLGRGLRKYPGKDKVQVLDFVANCDRLQMLDDMWRQVAQNATDANVAEDSTYLLINTNEIQFSESARDILELLNDIDSKTQQIDQLRADGWMSAANLANQLDVQVSLVKAICRQLGIQPEAMTYEKTTRLYLSPDDVSKIFDHFCAMYDTPPAGYMTMQDFSDAHNVHIARVIKLCDSLNIEYHNQYFRADYQTKPVRYLSPEQMELILQDEYFSLDYAPEGFLTKNQAREKISSISFKYLTTIMERLNITGAQYLTPKKYPSTFLSPDEFNTIKKYVDIHKPDIDENEQIPFSDVVSLLNISDETLEKILKDLDIRLDRAYVKSTNRVTRYFTQEQLDAITEHPTMSIESPPEGFVSIVELQELARLGETTVTNILKNLGIQPRYYREPTAYRRARYISPDDKDTFMKHELVLSQYPPDGYMTASQIGEQVNLRYSTIDNIAARLDITPSKYRNRRNTIVNYYSPEDIDRIVNSPQAIATPAPQGYETVTDIEKNYKIHYALAKKAIASLGIEPVVMRHPKISRIAPYYSPEQVKAILASIVPKPDK